MRRNFKPNPPTMPSPPPPSLTEQLNDLINRLEIELSRPDITIEHRLKTVPFLKRELNILIAQITNIEQINELVLNLENNPKIKQICELANPYCDHGQVPVQSCKGKVNPRDQSRLLFEDFKAQLTHKQQTIGTSGLFFSHSSQILPANMPPTEPNTLIITHQHPSI